MEIRRAGSANVIVFAPAMDEALRLVALEADQTVWLVMETAGSRLTIAVAPRGAALTRRCCYRPAGPKPGNARRAGPSTGS